MQLFKIAQEYDHILHDMYDDEGNENPQALAKLEENTLNLQNKAIAISSWVRNMEAEKSGIQGIKKEIDEAKKNILARERALENKIDRWKGYIKDEMEKRDISEIKCPYFVIKIHQNPASVEEIKEEDIPNDYWIISRKLDKTKMLFEMKNGVIIPGAKLKKGTRLSIK